MAEEVPAVGGSMGWWLVAHRRRITASTCWDGTVRPSIYLRDFLTCRGVQGVHKVAAGAVLVGRHCTGGF